MAVAKDKVVEGRPVQQDLSEGLLKLGSTLDISPPKVTLSQVGSDERRMVLSLSPAKAKVAQVLTCKQQIRSNLSPRSRAISAWSHSPSKGSRSRQSKTPYSSPSKQSSAKGKLPSPSHHRELGSCPACLGEGLSPVALLACSPHAQQEAAAADQRLIHAQIEPELRPVAPAQAPQNSETGTVQQQGYDKSASGMPVPSPGKSRHDTSQGMQQKGGSLPADAPPVQTANPSPEKKLPSAVNGVSQLEVATQTQPLIGHAEQCHQVLRMNLTLFEPSKTLERSQSPKKPSIAEPSNLDVSQPDPRPSSGGGVALQPTLPHGSSSNPARKSSISHDSHLRAPIVSSLEVAELELSVEDEPCEPCLPGAGDRSQQPVPVVPPTTVTGFVPHTAAPSYPHTDLLGIAPPPEAMGVQQSQPQQEGPCPAEQAFIDAAEQPQKQCLKLAAAETAMPVMDSRGQGLSNEEHHSILAGKDAKTTSGQQEPLQSMSIMPGTSGAAAEKANVSASAKQHCYLPTEPLVAVHHSVKTLSSQQRGETVTASPACAPTSAMQTETGKLSAGCTAAEGTVSPPPPALPCLWDAIPDTEEAEQAQSHNTQLLGTAPYMETQIMADDFVDDLADPEAVSRSAGTVALGQGSAARQPQEEQAQTMLRGDVTLAGCAVSKARAELCTVGNGSASLPEGQQQHSTASVHTPPGVGSGKAAHSEEQAKAPEGGTSLKADRGTSKYQTSGHQSAPDSLHSQQGAGEDQEQVSPKEKLSGHRGDPANGVHNSQAPEQIAAAGPVREEANALGEGVSGRGCLEGMSLLGGIPQESLMPVATEVTASMMEDSEEGASQIHSLAYTQAKADATVEQLTKMFREGQLEGGIYWANANCEIDLLHRYHSMTKLECTRIGNLLLSTHKACQGKYFWEDEAEECDGGCRPLEAMPDWVATIVKELLCTEAEVRFREQELQTSGVLQCQDKYALKSQGILDKLEQLQSKPSLTPESDYCQGIKAVLPSCHDPGPHEEALPRLSMSAAPPLEAPQHPGRLSPAEGEASDFAAAPQASPRCAAPPAAVQPVSQATPEGLTDSVRVTPSPAGKPEAKAAPFTLTTNAAGALEATPQWFFEGGKPQEHLTAAKPCGPPVQANYHNSPQKLLNREQPHLFSAAGSQAVSLPLPVPRRRPLPMADTEEQPDMAAQDMAAHESGCPPSLHPQGEQIAATPQLHLTTLHTVPKPAPGADASQGSVSRVQETDPETYERSDSVRASKDPMPAWGGGRANEAACQGMRQFLSPRQPGGGFLDVKKRPTRRQRMEAQLAEAKRLRSRRAVLHGSQPSRIAEEANRVAGLAERQRQQNQAKPGAVPLAERSRLAAPAAVVMPAMHVQAHQVQADPNGTGHPPDKEAPIADSDGTISDSGSEGGSGRLEKLSGFGTVSAAPVTAEQIPCCLATAPSPEGGPWARVSCQLSVMAATPATSTKARMQQGCIREGSDAAAVQMSWLPFSSEAPQHDLDAGVTAAEPANEPLAEQPVSLPGRKDNSGKPQRKKRRSGKQASPAKAKQQPQQIGRKRSAAKTKVAPAGKGRSGPPLQSKPTAESRAGAAPRRHDGPRDPYSFPESQSGAGCLAAKENGNEMLADKDAAGKAALLPELPHWTRNQVALRTRRRQQAAPAPRSLPKLTNAKGLGRGRELVQPREPWLAKKGLPGSKGNDDISKHQHPDKPIKAQQPHRAARQIRPPAQFPREPDAGTGKRAAAKEARAAPEAKRRRLTTPRPVVPAQEGVPECADGNADTGIELGCSKCRYSDKGCSACRLKAGPSPRQKGAGRLSGRQLRDSPVKRRSGPGRKTAAGKDMHRDGQPTDGGTHQAAEASGKLQWMSPLAGPPEGLNLPAISGRTYYSGFLKGGVKIQLQDAVELQAVPGQEGTRVALIEALWSEHGPLGAARMMTRCRMYYRPLATEAFQGTVGGDHSLFKTDIVEHRVGLSAVLRRCIILEQGPAHAAAGLRVGGEAGVPTYVCSHQYDPALETLAPIKA